MAEINERYEGNYLGQGNNDFPLDCETLEYIAQNRRMTEMLGAIAGDKVILNGCVSGQSGRSAGYVFLKTTKYPKGEVMYFAGGAQSACHVVEESVSVTSDGYLYPQAYRKRYLAPGTGSENYQWADFTYLGTKTNKELAARVTDLETLVKGLKGVPVGTVEMWAGQGEPTDEKYLICKGQVLKIADYEELYQVIKGTFNEAPNMNGEPFPAPAEGYFRLPDLQGRFICGQTEAGEYASKGATGGEKTHTLTAAESGLPAHTHSASCEQAGEHRHLLYGSESKYSGDQDCLGDRDAGFGSDNYTDNAGAHKHSITITSNEALSASQPHENRPPYYVLAYIIKAKN